MAKFTKKIRIAEYDVLNNQFILTFQLAGYADQLSFEASVDDRSMVYIDGDSDDILVGLGCPNGNISQMISELVEWFEKPRKSLGGLPHIHTIRSRFEVTERLEKERRGKAAVERIAMEAPCLDWAMSVTEEMVDEPVIRSHKPVSVSEEVDAFCKATNVSYGVEPKTSNSAPNSSVGEAAQQAVEAPSDRIAAMEAAGLGEEPVDPLDKLLDDFEDAIVAGQRQSFHIDKVSDREYWATQREGQRAVRSICDYVDFWRKPQPVPTAAIDKAVNAIHNQARRFTKVMTLREHDFLRSVIQKEIEKVVGGVL